MDGLTFWRALATFSALVSLWGGLLFWAVRSMLDSRFRSLDSRESRLEQNMLRVEKSLLHLRAELPLEYVLKEDAIRQEVIFQRRLDTLSSKLDQLRSV